MATKKKVTKKKVAKKKVAAKKVPKFTSCTQRERWEKENA